MRFGIFTGDVIGVQRLDQLLDAARRAERGGFDSFWLVNFSGHDALTALAVIGAAVPRIELGTNITPIYPRHPAALAQQALTAQAATGGRLVLGIGPSHKLLVEGSLGMSYARPRRFTEEYLRILGPLLRAEAVDFDGDDLHFHGRMTHPDAAPVPILLAALRPAMLALAGGLAAGTTTWMVGPESLAREIVPAIGVAAEGAGRTDPRVVAGVPVLVTDDVARGRELAATMFAIYGRLPAYQATLARDGRRAPEEAAIIGDEAAAAAEIRRYGEAGATDFAAVPFGANDEDRERTWALLERIARASGSGEEASNRSVAVSAGRSE